MNEPKAEDAPVGVKELARQAARSGLEAITNCSCEDCLSGMAPWIERAILADRASRAPVDGAEPVAWMFEIARDCDSKTGEPCNWKKLVSFSAPNAGKYQRNLTPLYLTPPAPAASPSSGVVREPDAELVRRVESELPGLFWEPNERGNLGTLRIRAHATGLGEIIARNVTMEHGKLIVSAILSKHGGDR